MSIRDVQEKIKGSVVPVLHRHRGDIFVGAIILLVAFVGFGLGRLSVTPQTLSPAAPSGVTQNASVAVAANTPVSDGAEQRVVASKSGSRYHLPDCPGALQISDSNKVWFASRSEAEKAGYTPASNCKGLQ
ncbi:MAG: hypothetical protein A2675_03605 [Candidatus Yonathbacteria bacterium RIFCSPHIGHO2_01_FULL_51_10]|uniref:Ada DNA repair metal-binding domain-containing protein n=1 Tax=Candidatus Yonathbacteria bacterium RIFCSPHIGHO2_01_FULL_51_10 TaxID=1802723 RepID=A0A1G2S8W7_9BACT|nr:MAG: hypothetical protein A2675_03605 [Candidatus Yonathbacteria bacterium RIFCSPHIGHO2_01_FULL_51_10]